MMFVRSRSTLGARSPARLAWAERVMAALKARPGSLRAPVRRCGEAARRPQGRLNGPPDRAEDSLATQPIPRRPHAPPQRRSAQRDHANRDHRARSAARPRPAARHVRSAVGHDAPRRRPPDLHPHAPPAGRVRRAAGRVPQLRPVVDGHRLPPVARVDPVPLRRRTTRCCRRSTARASSRTPPRASCRCARAWPRRPSAGPTVDRWHDALVPAIAPAPPAGVDVRPPLSSGRYLAAMLGLATAATIVLIAIITAIVLMTA